MQKILLMLALLASASLVEGCGYGLIQGTDKAQRPDADKVQILGLDPSTRRMMQGAPRSLHAFRLGVYTARLDNFVLANPALSSKSAMAKRILERVGVYLHSKLQVTFVETFAVSAMTCGGLSYPALSGSVDFLMFVVPENDPATSYFAAASHCADDALTDRPVVGSYYLNFAFLSTEPRRELTLFYVFLHEMTHLLGFSDAYYAKFVKSGAAKFTAAEATGTTTIGGKTFTILKFPELVAFAKTYYGCSTLEGVPLENDGGSGSAGAHWEKTFLPNEYMNPTVEDYPVVSEFTTALLRSTGWYTVATTAAQDYTWGKHAGCPFFGFCPTAAGYCPAASAGKQFCAEDFRTKGYCYSGSGIAFTDTCGIILASTSICEISLPADEPPKTSSESYGFSSRCIEYQDTATSTVTPHCHRVACAGGTLTVTMATGASYTCAAAGQLVSLGGTTSIRCPDPTDFCSKLSSACGADCYQDGKGICMKGGACLCFQGVDAGGLCKADPAFAGSASSPATTAGNTSASDGTTMNIPGRASKAAGLPVAWLLAAAIGASLAF